MRNIFTLMICFLWLSSSSAEEKHVGWKTLKNVYGWSIQYPDDWNAKLPSEIYSSDEKNHFNPENADIVDIVPVKGSHGGISVTSYLLKKQPQYGPFKKGLNTTPKDVLEGRSIPGKYEIVDRREIVVGNEPAYQITQKYVQEHAQVVFVGLKSAGKIFVIEHTDTTTERDIVSTFRTTK